MEEYDHSPRPLSPGRWILTRDIKVGDTFWDTEHGWIRVTARETYTSDDGRPFIPDGVDLIPRWVRIEE